MRIQRDSVHIEAWVSSASAARSEKSGAYDNQERAGLGWMNTSKSRSSSKIAEALQAQMQEYISSAGHKAGRGRLELSLETHLGGDTSLFKPHLRGITNL